LSLSYGGGQLWAGDRDGNLHVLDARHGAFDDTSIQVHLYQNRNLTEQKHEVVYEGFMKDLLCQ